MPVFEIVVDREERKRLVKRKQDKIVSIGLNAAKKELRGFLHKCLLGFKKSDFNPGDIVSKLEELTPLITKAITVAHFTGFNQTMVDTGVAVFASFDNTLAAFERQHSDSFKEVVQNAEFRAFNQVNELATRVQERVRESIRLGLVEGDTVPQATKRLEEAFVASGISPKQPHVLEQIFRTQSQLAFQGGEWESFQDPDVNEIIWGYEYITVGDDRVREEHADLEGTIAPKDDPIWNLIWPPNGYNCRCQVFPVFDKGRTKKPSSEKIDKGVPSGFRFNPGKVPKGTVPIQSTPIKPKPLIPLKATKSKSVTKSKAVKKVSKKSEASKQTLKKKPITKTPTKKRKISRGEVYFEVDDNTIDSLESTKITIQQAATILKSRGFTFEPIQPRHEKGKFIAQYKVNGKIKTSKEVVKLLKNL